MQATTMSDLYKPNDPILEATPIEQQFTVSEMADIIRFPALLKNVNQTDDLCETIICENYKCIKYMNNITIRILLLALEHHESKSKMYDIFKQIDHISHELGTYIFEHLFDKYSLFDENKHPINILFTDINNLLSKIDNVSDELYLLIYHKMGNLKTNQGLVFLSTIENPSWNMKEFIHTETRKDRLEIIRLYNEKLEKKRLYDEKLEYDRLEIIRKNCERARIEKEKLEYDREMRENNRLEDIRIERVRRNRETEIWKTERKQHICTIM
jgi:hypothetical protein